MVTLGDRPIFIDTNILIYANVASAPYHQLAIEMLQNLDCLGIELWLSRQIHDANIIATMLTAGIDRLLTHDVKDFVHPRGGRSTLASLT